MFIQYHQKNKNCSWQTLILNLAVTIFLQFTIGPGTAFAQLAATQNITTLNLPTPGSFVHQTADFTPLMMNGITIHPENPLEFDFIISKGDENYPSEEAYLKDADRLVKYFLTSLTVPEDELWVNLSPYEDNRIIPESFSQTDMGRDVLSQDYLLKQLTATLMYPEENLGADIWQRIYDKMFEQHLTMNLPMNTFNKVWIVPEKAVVFEKGNNAFVVESRLKVMLDNDYRTMMNNIDNDQFGINQQNEESSEIVNQDLMEIIRQVLIPEIENEINNGKNFSKIRQIFNALILADWYKNNLKQTLLSQVYVNQNKIQGIDIKDKAIKTKIYEQYLESFRKGVFNYVKEEYDPVNQEIIPRKYYSGGVEFSLSIDNAQVIKDNEDALDQAQLSALSPDSSSERIKVALFESNETNSGLIDQIPTGTGSITVGSASNKRPAADFASLSQTIPQSVFSFEDVKLNLKPADVNILSQFPAFEFEILSEAIDRGAFVDLFQSLIESTRFDIPRPVKYSLLDPKMYFGLSIFGTSVLIGILTWVIVNPNRAGKNLPVTERSAAFDVSQEYMNLRNEVYVMPDGRVHLLSAAEKALAEHLFETDAPASGLGIRVNADLRHPKPNTRSSTASFTGTLFSSFGVNPTLDLILQFPILEEELEPSVMESGVEANIRAAARQIQIIQSQQNTNTDQGANFDLSNPLDIDIFTFMQNEFANNLEEIDTSLDLAFDGNWTAFQNSSAFQQFLKRYQSNSEFQLAFNGEMEKQIIEAGVLSSEQQRQLKNFFKEKKKKLLDSKYGLELIALLIFVAFYKYSMTIKRINMAPVSKKMSRWANFFMISQLLLTVAIIFWFQIDFLGTTTDPGRSYTPPDKVYQESYSGTFIPRSNMTIPPDPIETGRQLTKDRPTIGGYNWVVGNYLTILSNSPTIHSEHISRLIEYFGQTNTFSNEDFENIFTLIINDPKSMAILKNFTQISTFSGLKNLPPASQRMMLENIALFILKSRFSELNTEQRIRVYQLLWSTRSSVSDIHDFKSMVPLPITLYTFSDEITASADNNPAGSSFDPTTMTFSWTPGINDLGAHQMVIIFDDAKKGRDTKKFTIKVVSDEHSSSSAIDQQSNTITIPVNQPFSQVIHPNNTEDQNRYKVEIAMLEQATRQTLADQRLTDIPGIFNDLQKGIEEGRYTIFTINNDHFQYRILHALGRTLPLKIPKMTFDNYAEKETFMKQTEIPEGVINELTAGRTQVWVAELPHQAISAIARRFNPETGDNIIFVPDPDQQSKYIRGVIEMSETLSNTSGDNAQLTDTISKMLSSTQEIFSSTNASRVIQLFNMIKKRTSRNELQRQSKNKFRTDVEQLSSSWSTWQSKLFIPIIIIGAVFVIKNRFDQINTDKRMVPDASLYHAETLESFNAAAAEPALVVNVNRFSSTPGIAYKEILEIGHSYPIPFLDQLIIAHPDIDTRVGAALVRAQLIQNESGIPAFDTLNNLIEKIREQLEINPNDKILAAFESELRKARVIQKSDEINTESVSQPLTEDQRLMKLADYYSKHRYMITDELTDHFFILFANSFSLIHDESSRNILIKFFLSVFPNQIRNASLRLQQIDKERFDPTVRSQESIADSFVRSIWSLAQDPKTEKLVSTNAEAVEALAGHPEIGTNKQVVEWLEILRKQQKNTALVTSLISLLGIAAASSVLLNYVHSTSALIKMLELADPDDPENLPWEAMAELAKRMEENGEITEAVLNKYAELWNEKQERENILRRFSRRIATASDREEYAVVTQIKEQQASMNLAPTESFSGLMDVLKNFLMTRISQGTTTQNDIKKSFLKFFEKKPGYADIIQDELFKTMPLLQKANLISEDSITIPQSIANKNLSDLVSLGGKITLNESSSGLTVEEKQALAVTLYQKGYEFLALSINQQLIRTGNGINFPVQNNPELEQLAQLNWLVPIYQQVIFSDNKLKFDDNEQMYLTYAAIYHLAGTGLESAADVLSSVVDTRIPDNYQEIISRYPRFDPAKHHNSGYGRFQAERVYPSNGALLIERLMLPKMLSDNPGSIYSIILSAIARSFATGGKLTKFSEEDLLVRIRRKQIEIEPSLEDAEESPESTFESIDSAQLSQFKKPALKAVFRNLGVALFCGATGCSVAPKDSVHLYTLLEPQIETTFPSIAAIEDRMHLLSNDQTSATEIDQLTKMTIDILNSTAENPEFGLQSIDVIADAIHYGPETALAAEKSLIELSQYYHDSEIDNIILPVIVPFLGNPNQTINDVVIRILSKSKNSLTGTALINLLDNENPQVVVSSIQVLANRREGYDYVYSMLNKVATTSELLAVFDYMTIMASDQWVYLGLMDTDYRVIRNVLTGFGRVPDNEFSRLDIRVGFSGNERDRRFWALDSRTSRLFEFQQERYEASRIDVPGPQEDIVTYGYKWNMVDNETGVRINVPDEPMNYMIDLGKRVFGMDQTPINNLIDIATTSTNVEWRLEATKRLGLIIGSTEAQSALIHQLRDKDASVKQAAYQALKNQFLDDLNFQKIKEEIFISNDSISHFFLRDLFKAADAAFGEASQAILLGTVNDPAMKNLGSAGEYTDRLSNGEHPITAALLTYGQRQTANQIAGVIDDLLPDVTKRLFAIFFAERDVNKRTKRILQNLAQDEDPTDQLRFLMALYSIQTENPDLSNQERERIETFLIGFSSHSDPTISQVAQQGLAKLGTAVDIDQISEQLSSHDNNKQRRAVQQLLALGNSKAVEVLENFTLTQNKEYFVTKDIINGLFSIALSSSEESSRQAAIETLGHLARYYTSQPEDNISRTLLMLLKNHLQQLAKTTPFATQILTDLPITETVVEKDVGTGTFRANGKIINLEPWQPNTVDLHNLEITLNLEIQSTDPEAIERQLNVIQVIHQLAEQLPVDDSFRRELSKLLARAATSASLQTALAAWDYIAKLDINMMADNFPMTGRNIYDFQNDNIRSIYLWNTERSFINASGQKINFDALSKDSIDKGNVLPDLAWAAENGPFFKLQRSAVEILAQLPAREANDILVKIASDRNSLLAGYAVQSIIIKLGNTDLTESERNLLLGSVNESLRHDYWPVRLQIVSSIYQYTSELIEQLNNIESKNKSISESTGLRGEDSIVAARLSKDYLALLQMIFHENLSRLIQERNEGASLISQLSSQILSDLQINSGGLRQPDKVNSDRDVGLDRIPTATDPRFLGDNFKFMEPFGRIQFEFALEQLLTSSPAVSSSDLRQLLNHENPNIRLLAGLSQTTLIPEVAAGSQDSFDTQDKEKILYEMLAVELNPEVFNSNLESLLSRGSISLVLKEFFINNFYRSESSEQIKLNSLRGLGTLLSKGILEEDDPEVFQLLIQPIAQQQSTVLIAQSIKALRQMNFKNRPGILDELSQSAIDDIVSILSLDFKEYSTVVYVDNTPRIPELVLINTLLPFTLPQFGNLPPLPNVYLAGVSYVHTRLKRLDGYSAMRSALALTVFSPMTDHFAESVEIRSMAWEMINDMLSFTPDSVDNNRVFYSMLQAARHEIYATDGNNARNELFNAMNNRNFRVNLLSLQAKDNENLFTSVVRTINDLWHNLNIDDRNAIIQALNMDPVLDYLGQIEWEATLASVNIEFMKDEDESNFYNRRLILSRAGELDSILAKTRNILDKIFLLATRSDSDEKRTHWGRIHDKLNVSLGEIEELAKKEKDKLQLSSSLSSNTSMTNANTHLVSQLESLMSNSLSVESIHQLANELKKEGLPSDPSKQHKTIQNLMYELGVELSHVSQPNDINDSLKNNIRQVISILTNFFPSDPVELQENSNSSPSDKASMTDPVGGINLNPSLFETEILRDPNGLPLPMNQQLPSLHLKINGFIPVILQHIPVNVPQYIGLKASGNETKQANNLPVNQNNSFKLIANDQQQEISLANSQY